MTTEATYQSECPECDNPIRPGDVIVVVDGEWAHATCRPLPALQICSMCFMEKANSGACGCLA